MNTATQSISDINRQISDNFRSIIDNIEPYSLEQTKNGYYTIQIENIYIHSKYDPIKEADRLFEIFQDSLGEIDILIINGAGLGYFLIKCLSFLKELKKRPVIIYIEQDIRIFRSLLSVFDLSEHIKDEKFKIFINPEKELVGSFVQSVPTKNIKYYNHRSTYQLNHGYYKELYNYLNYILDRKDMNTATFLRFQKLWTHNILHNAPSAHLYRPITLLNNISLGNTAVVVAGGPSLDKNINWIKNNQDKLIIIAVDTVVEYLKNNGVRIDIIVSIDPQYWNYKYLESVDIKDEILVTDISSYPKALKRFKAGNIFIPDSIFPLGRYILGDKKRGVTGAGGSVATTAFDTARIIGSSSIVLIGLDLSFPNRNTHFKGAFFEKNFLCIQNYFNTAESNSYRYLAHVDMQLIKYNDERFVYSDQKMIIFKKWFDREVPLTQVPVYMPYSGGAFVEGIRNVDLSEILLNNSNIMETRTKLQAISSEKPNTTESSAISKLNRLLECSAVIKKRSAEIIKLIPDDPIKTPPDIQKIEQLEKQLFHDPMISDIVDIISSSAQDILLSIKEEYEFDDNPLKGLWIKTAKLYNAINTLTIFFDEILKKLLKNLLNNNDN